ncbi:FUSC family protein [Paraburkholderia aromaticivorans]|uniref:FUSC family protein n=1 Tax=Paraburkholderia aromaticivorans TaxID=2026199 RepID=UPI001455F309|nr:FUSC family protein [Paraburkholderia aromaticivorans]
MPTSPTPASRQSPTLATFCASATEWARTDGRTWLYMFKAIAAALLALGIAMKLELPQPRTAMTTVFIVMQPESGKVLAKSFYRICGTLVGLVVMLALLGLFPQQPELFIITTALWVGLCTAGAARNRNFRSYGFVLAGYTAVLIGIPASQQPDGAFMSALTRVAEVTLGILCSGVVSALIFPEHAGEQMRTTVRARFSAFVDYVSATLSGYVPREQIEATNARFVADVVGFEAARSVAVFESPGTRMRSGRLSRLNSEFMAASTRFHALHQLMNRLHDSGADATIEALEPYFREIAPLLAKSASGEPVLSAADVARATGQLAAYKAVLSSRVRETRTRLQTQPDVPLLDFDAASELLYRFVDDLHAYTETYASLAVDVHERERWIERYEPKTNAIAAGVAGVRAAIVIMALGAFWIATAWPSGTTLLPVGAATCALASSAPYPARTAFQMAVGSVLASLVGLIVMFGIYPHIDGFPLLCAALTPSLLLGVYMTTKPKLAGYGAGYCIFFCFLTGPDNVIQYDPSGFINNALALSLSMFVSSIVCAVLLPPSTPWLRNRLLDDLRRQVVTACRGRLSQLRTRFESGARDLMFQINALAQGEPELKLNTLRWLFTTLEVGNAEIDLRQEIAMLPADAPYTASMPWRVSIRQMEDALAKLFDRPHALHLDAALRATAEALAAMQQMLTTVTPPGEERQQLQRILSHLHFIRTALLDPQSPLQTQVSGREAREGNHHVA